MSVWVEQTNWSACCDLAPGEPVLDVVRVAASGRERAPRFTSADAFSDEDLLLAMTDGRIIGWRCSAFSGQPLVLVVSMPLSAVAVVEADGAEHVLRFTFTDDTTATYRCAGDDAASFAATFVDCSTLSRDRESFATRSRGRADQTLTTRVAV